jgi:amino acid adenylation domain-containing protein
METHTLEAYQLSPQQKHLWLLQQVEHNLAYRVQCAILIEGRLDIDTLRAALINVVNRHEVLRTNFHWLPEMTIPVQVINDNGITLKAEHDLSGWDLRQQEAKVDSLFQKMNHLPFDFENGPLLHLSLVILSADKHILLVGLPALSADTVAIKSLVSNISRLYAGDAGDGHLDDAPQYADISEWQNELLKSEETEPGRKFWRKQNLSAARALKLPFEKRSPREIRFEPQVVSLTIDTTLKAEIEALAGKQDTSASVLLLTCWQILLWHSTRQSDIVVGTAYDGRSYEELEEALGLFTRYLPVHCFLEENSKFNVLLKKIDDATREIYKWQECFDYDEVFASSESANGRAFFPVCFDYVEEAVRYFADSVSFLIYKQYACVDRFKFKLCCVERNDSLLTEFHFDSNLFRMEDIKRLAGEFHTLLRNVINDPEAMIGDLEILSDSERHQILVDFNNTKADYPERRCIHQLFEEQVNCVPDNIAVVFEDQQLTYAKLNCRANQLAHHLQKLGVKPDVRVAIYADRSVEMMVAMLGVLKAGGAYAPLDTALPRERLAFLLNDLQSPVLLTQSRLIDRLPQHAARTVCLDTDWSVVAENSGDNLINRAFATDLAYVIYTSGSTGKPKGVDVEHRQLLNYVNSILVILDLPAGAGFATVSTLAADLGNTAIYPSLCGGGCLHLVSQERGSDPEALANYFERHSIDCLKIVPSHLTALLVSADSGRVLPRKRLILGGDVTHWSLIDKIEALAQQCTVLNHYGPTEATVGVLTYCVKEGGSERLSATLPLGRPISNTQIYLLDSRFKPVPIWVAGEVYIGGSNLARGYLNHPELTADLFIANPFSEAPGERLYKTGDLARYLPDGNIEFIGRADNQVKIRGYRIELGEIEATLNQHPDVQEAVVLVHEDSPGDKRLVAYLVISHPPNPSVSEMRSFLNEKLPNHMLPSAFVMLSHLQLTPNGKIDLRELPSPDRQVSNSLQYTPPLTEIENILITIWQKILDVPVVGTQDNYFSLGGDSIRVIQIVHEAKKYDFSITAMDLFDNPTIYELARYISNGRHKEGEKNITLESIKLPDHVMDLLPEDIEDAYPISGMQQFILFHYSNDHQEMGAYHIQHSYHVYDETLSLSALKRALNILVQRHTSLRTVFLTEGYGIQLQAVKESFAFSIKEDDIRHLDSTRQEEFIEAALIEDRRDLFDIKRTDEPLFRFRIFLRSEDSTELLISMHHAITDGWSNVELERELLELYMIIKNGVQPDVAALPNVYKEFIALEQEIISSKTALDFWNNHLMKQSHSPLKRRTTAVDGSPNTGEFIYLDSGLVDDLQSLARDSRVSLKALFLSAYLDLISMVTEQQVVTVGVVSNGRSERLSDPLKAVGLFWNIVPFCYQIDSGDQFSQIKTVQRLLIDIDPYTRYPLTKILEDQQTKELFFATFNFLHFHNAKEISANTGVRMLSSRAHDKFHFSMNYVVAIDPFDRQMSLRVEYDTLYFGSESNQSMINNYIERLKNLSCVTAR